MKVFDIIQVEDKHNVIKLAEYLAEKNQLTYAYVESLNSLKNTLEENRGNVYVLDGNFPREDGGGEEFLMQEAIDYIKSVDDEPNIILFSDGVGLDNIAHKNSVEYVDKPYFDSLIEKIKQNINGP